MGTIIRLLASRCVSCLLPWDIPVDTEVQDPTWLPISQACKCVAQLTSYDMTQRTSHMRWEPVDKFFALSFLRWIHINCDAVYVLLRGLAHGIKLCSSRLGMQNWIGSPSFAVLLPLSLTPAPWNFTSYYSGSTEPFAQALLFWGPILRHPVAEKSR